MNTDNTPAEQPADQLLGGKRVYGRFFDTAMRLRLLRDGRLKATRVVFDQGRYAVCGYTIPVSRHPGERQVYFYHLRRDGKIGKSWVPRPMNLILAEQGEIHVHE